MPQPNLKSEKPPIKACRSRPYPFPHLRSRNSRTFVPAARRERDEAMEANPCFGACRPFCQIRPSPQIRRSWHCSTSSRIRDPIHKICSLCLGIFRSKHRAILRGAFEVLAGSEADDAWRELPGTKPLISAFLPLTPPKRRSFRASTASPNLLQSIRLEETAIRPFFSRSSGIGDAKATQSRPDQPQRESRRAGDHRTDGR